MPLTDAQRQALGLTAGPTTAPAVVAAPAGAAPPAATGDDNVTGIIPALVGGGLRGAGDIVNTIPALTGGKPWVDPDQWMTTAARANLGQHPWAADIGRGLGQGAVGAAAAIPIGMALPETLPLVGGGLARNLLVGGLSGAVQGAGTYGETLGPSGQTTESIGGRMGRNALLGTAGALVARPLELAFGAGDTIASDVQRAGQTLQNAGVDITEANLPRAGSLARQGGAGATSAQSKQLNQALSKTFGQDTPDFSPNNLDALKNTMGPQIAASAARGEIDPTSPTSTFLSDLNNARAAAADPMKIMDPQDRVALNAKIDQIQGLLRGPTGKISGAQFHDLVGAGSDLDHWTDATKTGSPDLPRVAGMIDDALRNGFKASSPPDAYGDWITARTNYRLLSAIEKNVDQNGNVNPANLQDAIRYKFPDVKSLPSSVGNSVTQARDLAGAAKTAFGGTPGGGPAPGAGLGGQMLGFGGGGAGLTTALNYAFPSLGLNPLYGLAAAGIPIARAGINKLAQAYRASPDFTNKLLARGARQGGPYLTPLISGPIASSVVGPGYPAGP